MYPGLPPNTFYVSFIFLDLAIWTKDSLYYSCAQSVWEIVAIKKCSMSDRPRDPIIAGRSRVEADKQASGTIPTLTVRHLSCFCIDSLWPSFPHFYFCYTCLENILRNKNYIQSIQQLPGSENWPSKLGAIHTLSRARSQSPLTYSVKHYFVDFE